MNTVNNLFKEEVEQIWLKNVLRECLVAVEFVKKDGTTRKMICTLLQDKIPSEKSPKNSGKAESKESLAVFDVEKQDWRSFRYDSVTSVHFPVEI